MDQEQFIKTTADAVLSFIKEKNIADSYEISAFARALFDAVAGRIMAESERPTDEIRAQNAVLEVISTQDGRLYRRYLELAYSENDNGLRLSGEAMDGTPADIVFLSNAALEKLRQLKGMGPDEPECKR